MREKNASALCSQGDRVGIVLAKDRRPINIKGGAKAKQAVKALSKFGLISFSKEQTFKSSLYSVLFLINNPDSELSWNCSPNRFQEAQKSL